MFDTYALKLMQQLHNGNILTLHVKQFLHSIIVFLIKKL